MDLIKVQGYPVSVKDDYICLTDMAKADGKESRPAVVIRNWLRNKKTIDFLAVWEQIHNPIFKVLEFEHLRENAGNGDFSLSVEQWASTTDAIGVFTRLGKNGGTYAHRDIAFEFGAAISPAFKLYLIKEYQRLKEEINNLDNVDWQLRRMLSRDNYVIQTDAVKNYKIPLMQIPQSKIHWAYAEEGDIINMALFGFTAATWRKYNITLAAKNNLRDFASVNELTIISTLEGINAELIKQRVPYNNRLNELKRIANEQLGVLNNKSPQKSLKKATDGSFQPLYHESERPAGMFPQLPYDEYKTLKSA